MSQPLQEKLLSIPHRWPINAVAVMGLLLVMGRFQSLIGSLSTITTLASFYKEARKFQSLIGSLSTQCPRLRFFAPTIVSIPHR